MRDNFPVFGWIALGGRCRTCRLPISARYPIVEACVGFSLTVVGIAELYRLALPYQAVHWHGGPFWAPVIDRESILITTYHCVAVAVSWSFGLIRIDRQSLPLRLILFGLAVTVIPMLAFPWLMVVTWQTARPDSWDPGGRYLEALMRVLTALVAASIFGRSLTRGLCPTADPKLNPLGTDTRKLLDLIAIIAIPTVIVGWQASPAVVVLASMLAVVGRFVLPRRIDALGRFAIAMPVAMSIQLVLWRRLTQWAYWPSEGSSTGVFLVAAALVLCIPFWLHDRRESPPDESVVDEDEESAT